MERGLFALSDWPLPYPLPPDLLPYWSIGEAEDIVAERADETRLKQMSKMEGFEGVLSDPSSLATLIDLEMQAPVVDEINRRRKSMGNIGKRAAERCA